MNIIVRSLGLTVLALCSSVAVVQSTPKPAAAPAKPATHIDRGERVFKVNCSRCHNPPDHLNRRITGTVLRHMRVRASLSAEDERALLRFFNP